MSDQELISEDYAQRLLECAIATGRASELLHALFDGGSATITNNGQLIIVSGTMLDGLTSPKDV